MELTPREVGSRSELFRRGDGNPGRTTAPAVAILEALAICAAQREERR